MIELIKIQIKMLLGYPIEIGQWEKLTKSTSTKTIDFGLVDIKELESEIEKLEKKAEK